ncbi:MAG: ATP-binding protein [Anaerovoracaceae bacterium]
MNTRLAALTIFRGLLTEPTIEKLSALLRLLGKEQQNQEQEVAVSTYCDFVASLYNEGGNFSSYLLNLILNNENFYLTTYSKNQSAPPALEACLDAELSFFQELSALSSEQVRSALNYDGFLPSWETTSLNIPQEYHRRLSNLSKTGYGIFAKHHMFLVENGKLKPVNYPDGQQMDQLFGYEREQDRILRNTKALLAKEGAANMLLYGDAGTGKSSTIKAVANFYAAEGLRLIELKKNQLFQLPKLIETLSPNPLSFILFIDDLSFSEHDDNFSALKAILEGSVSATGKNIALYATSNRRHLIKETADQRLGNELHINDTLQETASLAARFGLTITFSQPKKEEYLMIVDRLAAEYGLTLPPDLLHEKAEAHALRCNGRSPRAAKQFIQLQKMGL